MVHKMRQSYKQNHPLQWMEDELLKLGERSLFRSLHETTLLPNGWLQREGRSMLNLASNDYLGLALLDRQATINQDYSELLHADQPVGAAASRLITGNSPVYHWFEEQFAAFKGTETSLIFSSGYMANLGIISTVVGRNDVVFSDRLNHASIVDGIILSRAKMNRYRHRDLDQLEQQLKQADTKQRKLIVTDSIFSMDGTIAPLKELVELKDRYGAMLMVDEAHSGGVFGSEGQGLVEQLGLTDRVEIQMGTFSKAYGCYGAYVAGSNLLKKYLVNTARSLIYTTALPPSLIQHIYNQWQRARLEGWRRSRLLEQAAWLRKELTKRGFNIGESECHIIPIIVGTNEQSLLFSSELRRQGIAGVAIRPPTVPEGQARIRFTIMASHSVDDLKWALDIIADTGLRLGVI
jgi:8-amino-7-oxononanoate synthase